MASDWDRDKVPRGMAKWMGQETATKDAAINPGKSPCFVVTVKNL
jgi:hypothetical protein